MGTHVIEAGFPVNSDAEFEAVRDIAEASSVTVCGLARVVETDIEAALDSGVDLVHTFVSTSDVQLQDSMHATRDEALQSAVDSVERITEALPSLRERIENRLSAEWSRERSFATEKHSWVG